MEYCAKNRSEFHSILEEVRKKYEDQTIVFRGQTEDRPMLPSMRRGESDLPSPGCIPPFTYNWTYVAERLISEFKQTKPTYVEVNAVMQHYGYRSYLIDVTSDSKIGLWFALHKFSSKKSPFHVDRQLRSARFQWSKYDAVPSGYVYVIKASEAGSTYEFVDLTKVMPTEASRIHAQRAGAIFCHAKPLLKEDMILAKIKVDDDGWFSKSPESISFTQLFPPPSHDAFYGSLCRIPYFVELQAQMIRYEVGEPLLGFFPIYAESVYDLRRQYVPLTRVLSSALPALEWNVTSATMDLDGTLIKAKDANRIRLSSLMVRALSGERESRNGLEGDVWPSRNLILELDPEVFALELYSSAPNEALRGLWIIFDDRTVVISRITDNFAEVNIGHSSYFSKPGLSLSKKSCNCNDHDDDLSLVRLASDLLENNTALLSKDKLGYLRFDSSGRNDKP